MIGCKYICAVICKSDLAALVIELAERYVETGRQSDKHRFQQALALFKKAGWDSAKKKTFVKLKGVKVFDVDVPDLVEKITGRVR